MCLSMAGLSFELRYTVRELFFADGGSDYVFDYGGPYSPKKHVFYKSDVGSMAGSVGWGWNNNALNYTIIRYADVLLLAAEAEIVRYLRTHGDSFDSPRWTVST